MPPKYAKSDKYQDIILERSWLTNLAGFANSTTLIYKLYRLMILCLLLYMAAMTVMSCVENPARQIIVSTIHSLANQIYIIIMFLAVGSVLYRSLEETRKLLKSGVFCYEDEEDDEEMMLMKESVPREIRRNSNIFICMFLSAGLNSLVVLPLVELLVVPGGGGGGENPFQPGTEDDSVMGRAFAWLAGSLVVFYMYTITSAVNWYYINGVVQLKGHFRLLNHSIANLQRRALAAYAKRRGLPPSVAPAHLFDDHYFQACLYFSFRANIQHHQALLRLRKIFDPFSGTFTLCVFFLAPFAYGCLLYLLSQVNPVNVTINLCLTFAAEQFTVIFICFLGEDVYTESEQVLNRLYSMDWFNYSKKFNQILQIMMANTLQPTGVKALLFGMPASLQTYGNVMSAMYKVTNLARESDLVD